MKIEISFIWWFLLGLVIGLMIQSCGVPLDSMNNEAVQYYLAAEVNTVPLQEVTEQVIYELEDIAYPGDRVRTDLFAKKSLQTVYSGASDTQALWAVAASLPTLPNEDEALPSGLHTLVDISTQNPDLTIRGIIVTNGTSDTAVIQSLTSASEALAKYPNVHVAVVGISPEHRAEFSQGFTPIRNRVLFASTKDEIAALFRSYGG